MSAQENARFAVVHEQIRLIEAQLAELIAEKEYLRHLAAFNEKRAARKEAMK